MKTKHDNEANAALSKIWEVMDYPCAENMHSAIPEYMAYFIKENDWQFDDVVTAQLKSVSIGTLKRRIASFRTKRSMTRGRSATVSSPLKGMIPIRKSHTWQELPPGGSATPFVYLRVHNF